MLFKFIAAFLIAACVAAPASQAFAADTVQLSADDLRLPDRAADRVTDHEQAAYAQVLDQYRRAQRAKPDDVSIVLAQCKFIEHFAWSEDLRWADVASKDFDACRATLDKQFPHDAEAALYVLEHRWGTDSVSYGTLLLPASKDWTAAQRARLHAKLWSGYSLSKDEARAGKEALLAEQLSPGGGTLIAAIRYLAKSGKEREAAALLAAAPISKVTWVEAQRINTAAEVLHGSEAVDELHRAQQAGVKIDAFTTARALQHVGDSKGAQAALNDAASSPVAQSLPNQQLRLEVAFDAGNAKAAAEILRDQYGKTGQAMPLSYAYGHLIALDPSLLFRADLFPLAGSLLAVLALCLASPGLMLFPAHYRGVVRQRIGKPNEPLFARIGLRHAWLALGFFIAVLYAVTIVRLGNAVVSTNGGSVVRIDQNSRYAMTHIWALGICVLWLVPLARLMGWRDWTGSGEWKLSWFWQPGLIVLYALLIAMSMHGPLPEIDTEPMSIRILRGALVVGGVPLALFVVSVIVPVIEEFVFRGCLLGGLTRHISFGWANFLQAATFALAHQDRKHLFYLFLMGLIAGVLAKRTKGLAMPVLLHAINNAIVVFEVVR